MLINEACKACGLTKKAIEYYEEQHLIHPRVLENGYRDFSPCEVARLKKISILRRLGLSVSEIQAVLKGKDRAALYSVSAQKALAAEMTRSKQALMQRLAQNQDWEDIRLRLEALEQKQTISERLLQVFPGRYGAYVCMHFALYLNEPVVSQEQREAFETIVSFLDKADLKIPKDLQEYLDAAASDMDPGFAAALADGMDKAVRDPAQYIADNREALEGYMAFRQTDVYRKSPAYRLKEFFAAFNRESGYYEIFIPAMKRLSQAYRAYHEAMEKANAVFMEKYPDESG